MNIKKVNTLYFKEEIQTDGNYPLVFLCDDGNVYYVKYILNRKEFDCLVYEFICSALLKELQIPTPDVAIVKVLENSFDIKQIKHNKKYFRAGVYAFASKEVKNTDLLNEQTATIKNKYAFNNYLNPKDIIKIFLFDIWVDNTDRKQSNYNLLIREGKKKEIIAIDHGFAFGGVNLMGMFNPQMPVNINDKIVCSAFFKQITNYVHKEEKRDIIEKFFYFCKQYSKIEKTITDVLKQLPEEWIYSKNIEDRIIKLLTSAERLNTIKQLISQELQIKI
ncbi:MAG: hypothetical protein PHD97_07425 [Bacteroidales bacterium]|nr:hypothetical protein [Bacteroidales bacterium]